MNATAISPLDFPALNGRTVTQAHTDLCASSGHAHHAVNGASTGTCPRCGTVTEVRVSQLHVGDLVASWGMTVRVTTEPEPTQHETDAGGPTFAAQAVITDGAGLMREGASWTLQGNNLGTVTVVAR